MVEEAIRITPIPREVLTRPPTREEERTQAERDIAGRLAREPIPILPGRRRRGVRIAEQTPAQQRAEAERIEQQRLRKIEATRLQGIREEARQTGIESRRLVGQLEAPPSVISEFQPTFIIEPPTARDDRNIFFRGASALGEFGRATGRFLIGERKTEEFGTGLPKLIVGKTDLDKPSDVPRIQTGTIIDPRSGIVTTQTKGERLGELIILGDLGTPDEIKVQNIKTNIGAKAQADLNKEASRLQNQINKEDITLIEAKEQLKIEELKLEKQAEQDFNVKATKELKKSGILGGEARRIIGEGKIDIAGFVETGAIVGGLVVAPIPTGTALIGLGGAKLFASVGEPPGQRGGVIASGLLDIGIGASAIPTIGTILKEEATTLAFKDIGAQPFKFKELVDVKFPITDKSAIALGAGRQFGRFEGVQFGRQLGTFSTEVTGKRIAFGETIGVIETTAKISPVGLEADFFKTFTKAVSQQFRFGQTVTTSQVGEGVTAFTGIADVAGKQIPIGGVTTQITPQTFLTRAGELTRANLFPGKQLQLDFLKIDTTISRVLPQLQPLDRTFRIVGPQRLFGVAPLRGRVTPGVVKPPVTDSILKGLTGAEPGLALQQITQAGVGGVSAVTSGLKFTPVSSFTAGLKFLPSAVATSEFIAGRLARRGALAGAGRLAGPSLAGPSLVAPSLKQFDTGITLVQPKLDLATTPRGAITPITSPAFRQPVAVVPKQPQVVSPILDQPQQPRFDFPRPPTGFGRQDFRLPAFTPPRGGFDFGFAPFFGLPTLGARPARKKKKKAKKKKRGRIRPSFTALTLDLRGVLPKGGGRLGITPFEIRAIPL